jgi:hypothetical protein
VPACTIIPVCFDVRRYIGVSSERQIEFCNSLLMEYYEGHLRETEIQNYCVPKRQSCPFFTALCIYSCRGVVIL